MAQIPQQIALVGAGIFVKSKYIPILAEISNLVTLKAIWSRTEVDMSLKFLKTGKHVLQEKPAAASCSEVEAALSSYRSLFTTPSDQSISAVAENYRFEPAFVESRKSVSEIGEMMSVKLLIDGSMNSSNPYFSSSWRRDLTVRRLNHDIAGLRMLVGCEVASVSAMTSHVNTDIPPPDIISSLFQLENGCPGVFVLLVLTKNPKIVWRVVGLNGTVQVERGNKD